MLCPTATLGISLGHLSRHDAVYYGTLSMPKRRGSTSQVNISTDSTYCRMSLLHHHFHPRSSSSRASRTVSCCECSFSVSGDNANFCHRSYGVWSPFLFSHIGKCGKNSLHSQPHGWAPCPLVPVPPRSAHSAAHDRAYFLTVSPSWLTYFRGCLDTSSTDWKFLDA